ncbi:MAG: hypothetical protein WB662_07660 [Methyloceanibacter sp.]
MANCFLCAKADADREAIIELLKPAQPIETGVIYQTNPSPEWRTRLTICEKCYDKIRAMPLAFL